MNRRSALLPTAALLLVTAIWGSTFVILKGALEHVGAADFLAVRFVLAALVTLPFAWSRLRRLSLRSWGAGLALGGLYGVAQLLQTVGLRTTAASVSGFITGMYVVLTPLLMVILFRTRISRKVAISSSLALVGLGVLSLQGTAIGTGELITLAGSAVYALHIIVLGLLARNENPVALTSTQLVGIAVVCSVAAVPGGVSVPGTWAVWGPLLYMVTVAGIVTMFLQTWAQGHIPATTAAVVMTFEPVFAALFALVLGAEQLTVRLVMGGSLILIAMLVSESGSSGTGDGDRDDEGGGRSAPPRAGGTHPVGSPDDTTTDGLQRSDAPNIAARRPLAAQLLTDVPRTC